MCEKSHLFQVGEHLLWRNLGIAFEVIFACALPHRYFLGVTQSAVNGNDRQCR